MLRLGKSTAYWCNQMKWYTFAIGRPTPWWGFSLGTPAPCALACLLNLPSSKFSCGLWSFIRFPLITYKRRYSKSEFWHSWMVHPSATISPLGVSWSMGRDWQTDWSNSCIWGNHFTYNTATLWGLFLALLLFRWAWSLERLLKANGNRRDADTTGCTQLWQALIVNRPRQLYLLNFSCNSVFHSMHFQSVSGAGRGVGIGVQGSLYPATKFSFLCSK